MNLGILYVLVTLIIQKGHETNIIFHFTTEKQLNKINKFSSDTWRQSHNQDSYYPCFGFNIYTFLKDGIFHISSKT